MTEDCKDNKEEAVTHLGSDLLHSFKEEVMVMEVAKMGKRCFILSRGHRPMT